MLLRLSNNSNIIIIIIIEEKVSMANTYVKMLRVFTKCQWEWWVVDCYHGFVCNTTITGLMSFTCTRVSFPRVELVRLVLMNLSIHFVVFHIQLCGANLIHFGKPKCPENHSESEMEMKGRKENEKREMGMGRYYAITLNGSFFPAQMIQTLRTRSAVVIILILVFFLSSFYFFSSFFYLISD